MQAVIITGGKQFKVSEGDKMKKKIIVGVLRDIETDLLGLKI